MSILVSNRQARRHLLHLAGLEGRSAGPLRKDTLSQLIRDLGFVQVDSVNVLERAHHHILFSRGQTYRRRDLQSLLEKDGDLFENWTHDASIIPGAFFPYWRHRFARQKERLRERWKDHFGTEGFDDDIARVHDLITRDGAKMARDFEGDRPSTGWWDWHPSKAALEYLWRTGELAIARRDGFQKVYDLTERVIPAAHRAQEVDHDAFVDWACREALHRLGFATRGEIASFWALLSPSEVDEWIARNRHDLVPVRVEGIDGKPRAGFSLPGAVDVALEAPTPLDRVRILSPFDPLLRDRSRTERIFGFHYRIEIFVPEAKRRYGYYVYPVLRGDNAIGRIDVKADRERDALVVRAFWPERGVRASKILTTKLETELERLRRFAGVSSVVFEDGWMKSGDASRADGLSGIQAPSP
ncbi:crosslink repair DNA glycosylase YcaQ family protein [Mesorhizobium sp. CAU 1732]|uniref:winged helix-turn-helix domain-containing protein n=1 Tax=Mesorhizobium sp. CAU 1732 TaxID=3140358 RepID=UPI0032617958